jgi:hypothetical protein
LARRFLRKGAEPADRSFLTLHGRELVKLAHSVTQAPAEASRRTLLLSCFGPALAVTLADALSSDARVICAETRAEVVPRAVHASVDVILLPAMDGDGVPTAPLVARLADVRAVVGVCVAEGDVARGLTASIQAGAVLVNWRTLPELRRAVRDLLERSAMTLEESNAFDDTLCAIQPLQLREVLLECTRRAHQRLTVARLADAVGTSSRTLNRWTHQAGWPRPMELILWGRVFRASLAQWRGIHAPTALARIGGFRSVPALRAVLKERLGATTDLPDMTPLRVSRALHRRIQEIS